MSEQQKPEFGEPWKIESNAVVNSDGTVVLDTELSTGRFSKVVLDEREVERIVACVNFCRGIPTESLVRWVSKKVLDVKFGTAAEIAAERAALEHELFNG